MIVTQDSLIAPPGSEINAMSMTVRNRKIDPETRMENINIDVVSSG